jgi:hypothetical protein
LCRVLVRLGRADVRLTGREGSGLFPGQRRWRSRIPHRHGA